MTDPFLLAAALLIALIAGTTQGITGFGFVMVAAPLMSTFADPRLVVPAMIVQTSATNVLILLHAYRHLRIRRMWLLALAGMAGAPAGTLVLLVLDAWVLRLLMGTVVTVAALAMMLGFRKTLRHELAASAPVGFASGALNASTGLAGPPVVLFYTNQELSPAEFRANVVAHFTMLNVATLPSFIIGGLFTETAMLFSAQLLPATLVGVVGGIVLNRWVREGLFRRLALVLVLIAGTAAAVSGVMGL